jgi:uncharacterized protein with NRDE domain
MCLIVFAHQVHRRYSLVLAANRDEFHARPTAAAAEWEDWPGIFGGRDLLSGGTWLGVTRTGRWAALTNFRDPREFGHSGPSRGDLVARFLGSSSSPGEYLQQVLPEFDRYAGFNLLLGAEGRLFWTSNRWPGETDPDSPPHERRFRELEPGIYGLSNDLLDTPWPKVERGKREITKLLRSDSRIGTEMLMELLMERTRAADHELPSTGVELEMERALSSLFISLPEYGTRSSSALLLERDGALLLAERRFDATGAVTGESRIELQAHF